MYVVIDGEKKEYVLVDGKYIPRDRIISVDTNNMRVVYVDYDGTIRVAELQPDAATAKRHELRVQPREVPV